MSKTIITYVRGENRRPIGCLVATGSDGNYNVGWSICHANDTFCKTTARKIALGRANSDHAESPLNCQWKFPGSKVEAMEEALNEYFVQRCDKYFGLKSAAAK
jgi:hypothetical protein